MAELRSAGKELVLTGEAQLLRLLERACTDGKNDTDAAVWALSFEICRLPGLKDRFEEAAINIAVIHEVSPPSWELQPSTKSGARVPAKAPLEMDDTALRLSGDLVGASDALVTTIRQWATANARKAAQGPLGIDFSGVRRVDFACANLLLMLSTRIHQAGATIRIRGTNELVAALFQVIGIYRVAHRVPRR